MNYDNLSGMGEKHIEKQLTRSLKALANERRLAILRFLKKTKEAGVGDIASEIKLSFKATSKHLSVLAGAGVIDRQQRSKEVFYFLSLSMPEPARRIMLLL